MARYIGNATATAIVVTGIVAVPRFASEEPSRAGRVGEAGALAEAISNRRAAAWAVSWLTAALSWGRQPRRRRRRYSARRCSWSRSRTSKAPPVARMKPRASSDRSTWFTVWRAPPTMVASSPWVT
jgi:hypothetical protein